MRVEATSFHVWEMCITNLNILIFTINSITYSSTVNFVDLSLCCLLFHFLHFAEAKRRPTSNKCAITTDHKTVCVVQLSELNMSINKRRGEKKNDKKERFLACFLPTAPLDVCYKTRLCASSNGLIHSRAFSLVVCFTWRKTLIRRAILPLHDLL